MPFGLANAPATFQRLMEVLLARLLEQLRRAGLHLMPTKCHLAQEQVEYLGHIVSAKRIQTDLKTLEAVESHPCLTDFKTLRFFGLASYYRRFISKFITAAHPLHPLTKKPPFVWTPQCQVASENLKQMLTLSPVALPQFDRPFILESDASGTRLRGVLAQK